MNPKVGGLALLSQSGAITTSLIDWAADEDIGFSHVVALGDMADVDVGDYVDLLAGDAGTRAILLYLETIPNARKFMSAARSAARVKPVIAVKAGRHAPAAKAAATHTGALAGSDKVVETALARAGVLRVRGLSELFAAAETVARFPRLERSRLGIITNGGGAGVLAVDRLLDLDGELAELSPTTIERLDKGLPAGWSRANPVDIIGDAPAARYAAAVKAVAEDPRTDALLVINYPTALTSPPEAARAVANLAQNGMVGGKPVLACWLGEKTAREGRHILQQSGVASFATPADGAAAASHLSQWSRVQRQLMRVPSSRGEDVLGDVEAVRLVLRQAAEEGRRVLTEPEAKAVLAAYGIAVPKTAIAKGAGEVRKAAERLLKRTGRVAVKLLSGTISHKSDVDGVALDITSPEAAEEAAKEMRRELKKLGKEDEIDGFSVQPMVARTGAQELILGVSRDDMFGPIILFGAGGTAVEVLDDTAVALPPLDDVLAGDLIDRTRVGRLVAGFRNQPPADRKAIVLALNALSQLVVDFPAIVSVDVNPLLADRSGVVALDARMEIEPKEVERAGPNPLLVIRPYPSEWEKDVVLGGQGYRLRPVKPADVSLYPPFLARMSPEDLRLRFMAPRRHFPHEMLVRLTQLDYRREIAFAALQGDTGELAGIARLSSDPDGDVGEYGLMVRTDLQGQGLGWALFSHLTDYAKEEGLSRIEGFVLNENTKMLAMCREFGFEVATHPLETGVSVVTLGLR